MWEEKVHSHTAPKQMGKSPLRRIANDKKDLVLIAVLFYLIF